jgi:hypothetical protein
MPVVRKLELNSELKSPLRQSMINRRNSGTAKGSRNHVRILRSAVTHPAIN